MTVRRPFSLKEYERRWTAVQRTLRARGFEGAVVWGRSGGTYERCANVLYLTNYYSTSNGHIADEPVWAGRAFAAVLLSPNGGPELHMDEPFPRLDLLAVDAVADHRDVIEGVAKAILTRGWTGPVALVGSDFFPVKYWERLRELTPSTEWRMADDLLDDVRRIKSGEELSLYREAGAIVSGALTSMVKELLAGRSEAEAAGTAAKEIIRQGGFFHMIPMNHGDTLLWWCRSPLPTWSQDAPAPSDMIRAFILGPILQGYWLDPGRTVVGPQAGSEKRTLVEATVNILEACIAAIRPGVPVIEIAKLGERMTADFGTDKDQIAELVPLFGHGVGLFWEHPFIGSAFLSGDELFEEGMVIGIEAFLGKEGVGSTAIEQNLIVTPDGTEAITTTPLIWH